MTKIADKNVARLVHGTQIFEGQRLKNVGLLQIGRFPGISCRPIIINKYKIIQ